MSESMLIASMLAPVVNHGTSADPRWEPVTDRSLLEARIKDPEVINAVARKIEQDQVDYIYEALSSKELNDDDADERSLAILAVGKALDEVFPDNGSSTVQTSNEAVYDDSGERPRIYTGGMSDGGLPDGPFSAITFLDEACVFDEPFVLDVAAAEGSTEEAALATGWVRPSDFEELVQDKHDEIVDEQGPFQDPYEAFLSGALYAALIAEGRD